MGGMIMQFYDPDHLVRAVQEHLAQQGLPSEVEPGQAKKAGIAAGMMLQAFGITPAMDGVAALVRAMDKPWPDNDDANAAQ
jgi:hypothetical protein